MPAAPVLDLFRTDPEMSFPIRVVTLTCVLGLPGLGQAFAAGQPAVPMADRARGAERVVLGRVASVNPQWRVNEFGDRLITSILRVTVDETLKGQPQANLDVEV